MTLQNTPRRVGVTIGNDNATEFPFSFKLFSNNLLNVFVSKDFGKTESLLKRGRDYEIRPNDNQDETPGGTLVLLKPLTEGDRLAIVSDLVPEQQAHLTNYGRFSPETLNSVHDRVVGLVQEIKADMERTVSLPRTSEQKPEAFIKEFFQAHDEAIEAKAQALGAQTQAQESAQSAGQASAHVDEAKREVDSTAQEMRTVKATAEGLKTEIARGSEALSNATTQAQHVNSRAETIQRELDTLKATVQADAGRAEQANVQAQEAKAQAESAKDEALQAQASVTGTKAEITQAVSNATASIASATDNATRSISESVSTAKREVLESANSAKSAVRDAIESGKAEVTESAQQATQAITRDLATATQKASEASASATLAQASARTAQEIQEAVARAKRETDTQLSQAQAKMAEATRAGETAQAALRDVQGVKRAVETTAERVAQDKLEAQESAQSASQTLSEAQAAKSEAQALKGQIETAKAEVARSVQEAKSAAAGAVAGQVQADWTEASGSSKAFIRNKPTTFPPATHTHQLNDIDSLEVYLGGYARRNHQHMLHDITGLKKYGTVARVDYADIDGVPEVQPTTWEVVQNKPSTFPPAKHTHQLDDIDALQVFMGGYARRNHTHTISQLTDLQKYGTVAQVAWADITGVPNFTTNWTSLEGKPSTFTPSAHSHQSTDILDLTDKINESVDEILTNYVSNQNFNRSAREISGWTVTPGNGVATSSLFFQIGNSHKYEIGVDNNRGEFFIWDKKNNANVARFTRSSAQLYGNLNMNGNYLSNVHEPSSDTDGATKRYVDNGLRGKANTSHTHQASEISGLPAPVDTSTLVKATGERGPLGGYELAQVLSGNTCSVGTSSKDTLVWKTSGACTLTILPDSDESHCAVKLLYMKATAQTTLTINGGRFVGGEKPTWGTAGKRLTLACHFVNGEVNISVVENEEG